MFQLVFLSRSNIAILPHLGQVSETSPVGHPYNTFTLLLQQGNGILPVTASALVPITIKYLLFSSSSINSYRLTLNAPAIIMSNEDKPFNFKIKHIQHHPILHQYQMGRIIPNLPLYLHQLPMTLP